MRQGSSESNFQGSGVLVVKGQTLMGDVETWRVAMPSTATDTPELVNCAIVLRFFHDFRIVFPVIMGPHRKRMPTPSVSILGISVDNELKARIVFDGIGLGRWQLKLELIHVNRALVWESLKKEDHPFIIDQILCSPCPLCSKDEPVAI